MEEKGEYVSVSIGQLGSAGAMMAEKRIEQMSRRIAELEEFVREVAAGPYPDSDPNSLLKTLQERASSLNPPNQIINKGQVTNDQ